MEQNKESEERDLSLTESDYVLIRMVVGSSPTRRAKKKSRSKDLLFLFAFFSLPALPQRLMSVHLPLADFNLGRS